MHMQLHQTEGQAVRIGIILAVFSLALFEQLGRAGKESGSPSRHEPGNPHVEEHVE